MGGVPIALSDTAFFILRLLRIFKAGWHFLCRLQAVGYHRTSPESAGRLLFGGNTPFQT